MKQDYNFMIGQTDKEYVAEKIESGILFYPFSLNKMQREIILNKYMDNVMKEVIRNCETYAEKEIMGYVECITKGIIEGGEYSITGEDINEYKRNHPEIYNKKLKKKWWVKLIED
ncbi:unnamed protein product [marine sediment metagenome]|uniref:Uncharacterized protein n=1 Tax=marine sediment metagenome TaxID=412755 RepID=X0SWQ9_9ZZZZ